MKMKFQIISRKKEILVGALREPYPGGATFFTSPIVLTLYDERSTGS
jgi:hypothetical protein